MFRCTPSPLLSRNVCSTPGAAESALSFFLGRPPRKLSAFRPGGVGELRIHFCRAPRRLHSGAEECSMSDARGEVYSDGKLAGYFWYHGTVDIASRAIYPDQKTLEEHWRSPDNDRKCACGRPPVDVVLWADYGRSFWWPSTACFYCMAITGSRDPWENDAGPTRGHPFPSSALESRGIRNDSIVHPDQRPSTRTALHFCRVCCASIPICLPPFPLAFDSCPIAASIDDPCLSEAVSTDKGSQAEARARSR
jgi:hypothetical protein